jgi:NitT/TauT family transport system permease protein/putative hydroxymethylpyrimidine transport system permease protein
MSWRGRSGPGANHAGEAVAPVLLMLFILASWEALVRLLGIPTFVLPTPTQILATVFSDRAIIFRHMLVTLFEIVSGYALAAVLGFVVSLATVYSTAFRRGALPLIVAAQTIPVIAIAPILVIWFGYNAVPRIIITALVAFFPLTISFVTGLQSVTPDFVSFFRSLNASEVQIFLKLRLPNGLANIFAGLKVATTLAVVGATISEWVGASEGIGYLMAQDTAQINTTRVFASLVVLGVFGMAFFAAVGLAERVAMPWVYGKLAWPGLAMRAAANRNLATASDAHE